MNEVQLIRSQLGAEREHLKEVASWCAALQAPGAPGLQKPGSPGLRPPGFLNISQEIIISYANYFLNSLNKERARSAAHLERLDAHFPAQAERAAIDRLRNVVAACALALGELHTVLDASRTGTAAADGLAPLARCGALAGELVQAQIALEALAADRYTVDDWRRVAHVDADSILEERRLRAEVLRHGAATA